MHNKILIFYLVITATALLSATKKNHHNARPVRRPVNKEYSYYSDEDSYEESDNDSQKSEQTRVEITDYSYSDDEDERRYVHNKQPPMRHQSSHKSNRESFDRSMRKEFDFGRSGRSFSSHKAFEENGHHNTGRTHQPRRNTHHVNNEFNFNNEFESNNRNNNYNPNRPHNQQHNQRNDTGQYHGINILDLLRFSRMKGWPIIAGLMVAHEYYPTATNIVVAIASVFGLAYLAKKMKLKQWFEKTEKEINKNIHHIICSLKNVYPEKFAQHQAKSSDNKKNLSTLKIIERQLEL